MRLKLQKKRKNNLMLMRDYEDEIDSELKKIVEELNSLKYSQ